jgi:hypothetical protein
MYMSGGYFNYDQYRIGQIADEVEQLIISNENAELNEWGNTKGRFYPPEVIEKFKIGYEALRVAQIYAQRIDWLVSGDDGEEWFLKRLEHELGELK